MSPIISIGPMIRSWAWNMASGNAVGKRGDPYGLWAIDLRVIHDGQLHLDGLLICRNDHRAYDL